MSDFGLNVGVKVNLDGLRRQIRALKQSSKGLSGAVKEVNVEIAQLVADDMAQRETDKVEAKGRPQRPGTRMAMALRDKRNQEVTSGSIKVGLPSWFEQEASQVNLYWRFLDKGREPYQTRALFTDFSEPFSLNRRAGRAGYLSPSPMSAGAQLRMPTGRGPLINVKRQIGYDFGNPAAARRFFDTLNIHDRYVTRLRQLGFNVK